jgi:hypothetical protein
MGLDSIEIVFFRHHKSLLQWAAPLLAFALLNKTKRKKKELLLAYSS